MCSHISCASSKIILLLKEYNNTKTKLNKNMNKLNASININYSLRVFLTRF